jgi:hypothetical protein
MCLELIRGLVGVNKDHGFVSNDGSIQIYQGTAGGHLHQFSVQIALNLYHIIIVMAVCLKFLRATHGHAY